MSDGFEIQQFRLELYPVLEKFANSVHLPVLLDRRFLDHYYLGQEWNRLFLVLASNSSECLGAIGVDLLRFAADTSPLKIGFATNFYSLQSGAGGMLWLKWMKLGQLGLVFGGSQDAHRILRARNFHYYPGINLYRMNAQYEGYKEDSSAKRIVKTALRPWFRKKLPDYASKSFLSKFADLRVVEQPQFSPEMLVESSPFLLRFDPPLEYLQWRYNPRLDYIRYRIFQFFSSGRHCGYCVLNDGPKELIVAHADGSDPEKIAAGILKALFLVGEDGGKHRKAMLASSHPAMQAVFTSSGFCLAQENYPFATGALRNARDLGDPRSWLINFGIGDNDLRQHMFWPTAQTKAH